MIALNRASTTKANITSTVELNAEILNTPIYNPSMSKNIELSVDIKDIVTKDAPI